MLSSLRSRLSQTSRPHLRWTAGGHVGKKHFNSEATSTLPSEADVVIIGGGAIGCSTLYHLSKRGVNAVLVEKDAITAGTTWHSAGLVWRLRPNDTDAKMINRTRELVKDGGILSQETGGLSCGWNSNGGLFIANTKERLDEYKRLQTIGRLGDKIDCFFLSFLFFILLFCVFCFSLTFSLFPGFGVATSLGCITFYETFIYFSLDYSGCLCLFLFLH